MDKVDTPFYGRYRDKFVPFCLDEIMHYLFICRAVFMAYLVIVSNRIQLNEIRDLFTLLLDLFNCLAFL